MTDERKAELRALIVEMRAVSDGFYRSAVRIQVHTFIEFTGFINEFIIQCERAINDGVDFTVTSTHTGDALPLEPHQAAYIGEKFDCIFGPSMRGNPAAWERFREAVEEERR